jgi:hypothetical protein
MRLAGFGRGRAFIGRKSFWVRRWPTSPSTKTLSADCHRGSPMRSRVRNWNRSRTRWASIGGHFLSTPSSRYDHQRGSAGHIFGLPNISPHAHWSGCARRRRRTRAGIANYDVAPTWGNVCGCAPVVRTRPYPETQSYERTYLHLSSPPRARWEGTPWKRWPRCHKG